MDDRNRNGLITVQRNAKRDVQLNLMALIGWLGFLASIIGLILNKDSWFFTIVFLLCLVCTGLCIETAGPLVTVHPHIKERTRNDGKILLPLGSTWSVQFDLLVYLRWLGLTASFFGVIFAVWLLDSLILAALFTAILLVCGMGIIYGGDLVTLIRARGDH